MRIDEDDDDDDVLRVCDAGCERKSGHFSFFLLSSFFLSFLSLYLNEGIIVVGIGYRVSELTHTYISSAERRKGHSLNGDSCRDMDMD